MVVLQHHDDDGAGALGRLLEQAGLRLEVVRPYRGEPVPERPDHDALVVLGGEMQVWEQDRHPWLAAEKALIRTWTAADRGPLLGICLGHQLLADALGGTVGLRSRPEAGVQEVRATEAGRTDELIGRLGGTWDTLQWHGAEVTAPPPGAVVLAANEACGVQAMRVGSRWWGVQFHPEVDRDGVASWTALPGFGVALDASDGSGAAEAFATRHEAARPGLDAVTAALAAGLVDLLDPQSESSTTAASASSTARSRS